MGWFWYSVALPFGALLIGLGACVLYWLIKHGRLKEVAKPAGSFIEEDPTSTPATPVADVYSR